MVALVIAPHADDEVLGCGATMARWASEGVEVHVGIVTQPAVDDPDVGFRYGDLPDCICNDRRYDRPYCSRHGHLVVGNGMSLQVLQETISQVEASSGRPLVLSPVDRRRMEALTAGAILGVPADQYHFAEAVWEVFTDQLGLPRIVTFIRRLLDEIHPDTVLMPHWSDLNLDHRRVAEAAMVACRPPGPVLRLLAYSVDPWVWPGSAPSSLGHVAYSVTTWMEAKVRAVSAYVSESRPWPHARSSWAVRERMRMDGVQFHLEAAEVFTLVWEVR